jgi:uncharacterized delta-60 repeat protein
MPLNYLAPMVRRMLSTLRRRRPSPNRDQKQLQVERLEERQVLDAGTLDLTFGSGGVVTTDFLNASDFARAIQVEQDGKILLVGRAANSLAMARYNPDGSLDTSFGTSGRVISPIPAVGFNVRTAAIGPDGKIVLAGFENLSGDYNFAAVRFNANGTLDTGFAGDGTVTVDFGGNYDVVSAVTVQSDGKIILAGAADQGAAGGRNFAAARFNTDGSLDTLFSGDGKVTIDFAGSFDEARSLVVQSDGKIILAGHADQGAAGGYNFAAARLDANGSLDTSFAGDGKVTIDFAGDYESADAVALQSDGKIVLAGQANEGAAGGTNFAVARFNSDGTLDTSFAGDGTATVDFAGAYDDANAVVVQPDGKIVLAGVANEGAASADNFAAARFLANGTLDTGFAGDGTATVDFAGAADIVNVVTLQSDGKIVLAGSATQSGAGGNNFALVRLLGESAGTTEVALVNGELVITDIDGGDTDDTLTISTDGSDLVISDPNNLLVLSGIAGTGDGTNSVRIPLNLLGWNGNIVVNTEGGVDSVTLGNLSGVDGITINGKAGDTVTTTGAMTLGGELNITTGTVFIGANIFTAGDQTYSGAVVLTGNVILDTTEATANGVLTITGTLTGDGYDLAIETGTGVGSVGGNATGIDLLTLVRTGVIDFQAGLAADSVLVAPDRNTARLRVSGGTVTIGNGDADDDFLVGRNTTTSGSSLGIADFSGVTSATFDVDQFHVGVKGDLAAGSARGLVTLANNNLITANAVIVGQSGNDGFDTLGQRSELHLGGGTNTIATATLIVGDRKTTGLVDFATAGGTLNLGSAGARTSIVLGRKSVSTANRAEGTLDLRDGTVSIFASNITLGQETNTGGTGAPTGTLILGDGMLDVSGKISENHNSGGAGSSRIQVLGDLTVNMGTLLDGDQLDVIEIGGSQITDDFESYGTGAARDVASPPWDTKGSGLVSVELAGGNQFLSFGWNSNQSRGASRSLGAGTIDNGTTGVVAFDVRVDDNRGESFYGVAAGDPSTAQTQNRLAGSNLRAFVGLVDDPANGTMQLVVSDGTAGGQTVVRSGLSLNTWYAIQMVVDNATGTYNVFLDGTQVATGVNFRSGFPNADLDYFVVLGKGEDTSGSGGANLGGHLDNLVAISAIGTLDLSGIHSASGIITVNSQSSLTGDGSAANSDLVVHGTVAPGNGGPGLLQVGETTFHSLSTFDVELNGATAGTGYDQLAVSGAVDLGGATLNLSLGFTPTAGQVFTIIDNNGTDDPTTGNFVDASSTIINDGDIVQVNGVNFYLFYNGGDGNDVVLVEASAPPTVVYVNDDWASDLNNGETITDADAGTNGDQGAIFGVNAFATLNDALLAVDAAGTIIVNGGAYNETVNLTGTIRVEITGPDAQQSVTIAALSSVAGTTIAIEGTSVLIVGNTDNQTIAGVISGTGSLTKQGTGTLTLQGTGITYTGDTTVNAGQLIFQDATNFATGTAAEMTLQIATGAVLTFDVSSNHKLGTSGGTGDGVTFTGGGTLRKVGAGRLDFGDQGSAAFKVNVELGSDALIDIQAGTLRNGGWAGQDWSTNLADLHVASGAIFDVWDGNTVRVDAVTGAGQITRGIAGGPSTLIVGVDNGSGDFSGFMGSTTGSVTLQKLGTGTQTLSGTQDNNALTATVNAGVLVLAKTSTGSVHALGGGGTVLTINSGGTARLAGTGDDQIYFQSDVVVNSGGVFDLNGHSEGFDALSGGGTIDNTAAAAVTLTIGQHNNGGNFSGIIQDTGGSLRVVKTGTSGAAYLSGTSSTYEGGTEVNQGILLITNDGSLGSTSGALTLRDGGVLQNNNSDVILSASRDVILASGTGGFRAGWAKSITINGQITGAGNFRAVNDGGGRIILTNSANDYSGDTIIGGDQSVGGHTSNNVTLQLGAANVIPNGAGKGNLIFDPAAGKTAILDLNGFSETINGISVLSGNAIVRSSTGSGVLTVGDNNADGTFGGLLENGGGTLGLAKIGTGTLTLTGNNTYSGGTTLGDGSDQSTNHVQIGSDTALGTGFITFLGARLSSDGTTARNVANDVNFGASSGVSAYLGSSTQNGKLTFTGNADLEMGDRTLQIDSEVEFTGAIADGGATPAGLSKTGTGTLTLSGTNTYSGFTEINTGTLVVAGGQAINNASALSIGASGILDVTASEAIGSLSGAVGAQITLGANTLTVNQSANGTFAGVISGTGAMNKQGTATLTYAGSAANTYSGITTVSQGTLHLNKTTGQDAIAGDLEITTGGKVTFGANHQINNNSNVTMSGAGSVFNGTGINAGHRGQTETLGSLTVTGGAFNVATTGNWTVTGATSFTGGSGNTIYVGNSGGRLTTGSLALTNMTATAGNTVPTNNSFTVYGNSTSAISSVTVGAGGLTLNNSRLNLRQGGTGALGSRLIVNGNITAAGTSAIFFDTAGGTTGTLETQLSSTAAAVTRDITVNGGSTFTMQVPITNGSSTSAGINKLGAGTLAYTSANSYTGLTTVGAGVLHLNNTSSGNAIVGDLAVTNGGHVTWGANHQLQDSVNVSLSGAGSVLNGTGVNVSQFGTTETFGSLTATGGTFNTGAGSNWTITGAASFTGGSGNTIYVGNSGSHLSVGSLTLVDMTATASGGVGTSNSFTVYGSNTTIRSSLTVGTGGLSLSNSVLNLRRGNADGALGSRLILDGDVSAILDNSEITIDASGGTIGSVDVELSSTSGNASRNFSVATSATLAIDIALSNGAATAAAITKSGDGTLTLFGNSTYSGATDVNAGTLLVNGAIGSNGPAGLVTVAAGATLGGTGSINADVNVSGTLSPGLSPGQMSTGGLEFEAGSTYVVEMDGTTPGDGAGYHDQVVVSGPVELGNAILDVSAGIALTNGQSFTIIDNDDTDSVSGIFLNATDSMPLTEGMSFTQDGQTFTITYTGGDGNDVVLFAGAAETEVSLAGGVLRISDITTDSVNDLTISYDSGTNTYTISESAAANVIGTSGVTVISRTATSVTIDATGITSIQIDTSGPTSGVEAGDRVNFVSNIVVNGDITVTSDRIDLNASLRANGGGDLVFDGHVYQGALDVTLTATTIEFQGDTTLHPTDGSNAFILDANTATNTVGNLFDMNGGRFRLQGGTEFINNGAFETGGIGPIFATSDTNNTFTNNGTFTHNGAQLRLYVTITNTSTGTFTIDNPAGDSEIQFHAPSANGPGGVIRNQGQLTVSEANARFDNFGSIVNESGGIINFAAGSSSTISESVSLTNESGGTVNVNGNFTVNGTAGAVINKSGGTIHVNAGLLTVSESGSVTNESGGTINLDSNLTINGGAADFTNEAGGQVNLVGGALTISLVDSAAEFTNLGTVSWTSGANGNKTINGSGTFQNTGVFNHNHGGSDDNLIIDGSVTFQNDGTFNFNERGDINLEGNAGFVNNGDLIKVSGTGDPSFVFTFGTTGGTFTQTANGTVESKAGRLRFATERASSHADGTWIASGGDIEFAGSWTGTIVGTTSGNGDFLITNSSNAAVMSDFSAGAGGIIFDVSGNGLTWNQQTINTSAGNVTNAGILHITGTTGTAKLLSGGGELITADGATTTVAAAVSSTGGSRLRVNSGGLLSGDGSFDGEVIVELGGTLSPGPSTGQLLTGDLDLQGGSVFEVDILGAGTVPGTDFDQVVADSVTIGTGAILSIEGQTADGNGTFFVNSGNNLVFPAYDPGNPYTITLIDQSAGQPVPGPFHALDEGDTVVIDGQAFRITYQGGIDGNDVELVRTAAPDIQGTNGDDVFLLRLEGPSLVLRRFDAGATDYSDLSQSTVLLTADPADLDVLSIEGRGGNDLLIVDWIEGDPLAVTTVNWFGGLKPTDTSYDPLDIGNTLMFRNLASTPTTVTSVDISVNGVNGSATVDFDGANSHETLSFNDVSLVNDDLEANDRTVTFAAGNETVTLFDSGTVTLPDHATDRASTDDDQSQAQSTLGMTVQFDVSGDLTLNVLGGQDIVTVTSLNDGFSGNLTLNTENVLDGDDDGDTIEFTGALPEGFSSLTTISETITIENGGFTTTAAQSFTGRVELLGQLTVLNASTVEFHALRSTVGTGLVDGNSARDLTLNLSDDVYQVDGTELIAIRNLTVNVDAINEAGDGTADDRIEILNSVMTDGTQIYQDSVFLQSTLALTATEIAFASTLDAETSGQQGLTVAGNAVFNDQVGEQEALASLLVTGTTTINTDLIQTAGRQEYRGDVTMPNAPTFISGVAAGADAVVFGGWVPLGNNGSATFLTNGVAVFGPDSLITGILGTLTSQLGSQAIRIEGRIDLGEPTGGAGQLVLNGNVALAASTRLDIDITGATPDLFDVLTVNGTIALNGAGLFLTIDPAFGPQATDTFTFINGNVSNGLTGNVLLNLMNNSPSTPLVNGTQFSLSDSGFSTVSTIEMENGDVRMVFSAAVPSFVPSPLPVPLPLSIVPNFVADDVLSTTPQIVSAVEDQLSRGASRGWDTFPARFIVTEIPNLGYRSELPPDQDPQVRVVIDSTASLADLTEELRALAQEPFGVYRIEIIFLSDSESDEDGEEKAVSTSDSNDRRAAFEIELTPETREQILKDLQNLMWILEMAEPVVDPIPGQVWLENLPLRLFVLANDWITSDDAEDGVPPVDSEPTAEADAERMGQAFMDAETAGDPRLVAGAALAAAAATMLCQDRSRAPSQTALERLFSWFGR